MTAIRIELVENGFIVTDNEHYPHGVGRQWVYQSPMDLAGHIKQWGEEVKKSDPQK